MHALSRWLTRGSHEAGFTLVEILIACAIIGLGLVAVSAGFGMGVEGVEAGRQQSTAVFLAEQRMEQVRAAAMAAANLANVTAANFPAEAYGSIAGAARYRRTVTIVPNAVPAGARVDVIVFYQPVTGWGVLVTERQLQLSVFLASR